LFAHNKIKFHQIVPIIDMCINKFKYHNIHNLNDIYNVNEECNLQIFKILNIVNSVD
jgi:1-deoxy-D-xylulose 5-phosphate reductoisomerase